ncbi:YycH family regulatory protein [Halalkalibacter sp. APA_J-10(15)]|uniref:YycH family regulatory protein n=1 Tax=Halalkalibacter sp. APA_J-10(15) TaxID=2933805 RepID=UPI001FF503BD|nr:two-component system activity regulator YycH [Halalkalibacter sp. APA_J-10(15)]MCK0469813.1 two-component system activity regulator YycH [Halalkalibacter sp. APA_J-10(15)]
MNKEHMKSAILIILIGMSVILSWSLYTYQPDIALLDVSSRYVSNELIGEERSLQEVIRPDQIVVHADGEKAMIPRDREDFYELLEKLGQANYEADHVFMTEPYPLITERGGIELVFPTSIPAELFFTMLTLEDDYQTPISEIDRVYLYIHDVHDQVYMQYYSSDERRVGSLKSNLSVGEFERLFIQNRDEYVTVRSLEEERAQSSLMTEHVYVTTEPMIVDTLSYGASPISIDLFRQSLFTDPSAVKYYQQSDGEDSYTDGNRMINLRHNGTFMEYGNPMFSEVQELSKHVTQAGYEFINGHGGWTDDYILSNWMNLNNREEVEFRLHMNGLPVFSIDGKDLMKLSVMRSGNQIVAYSRPLFDLDLVPLNTTQRVELPSGEDVVRSLQQDDYYERQRIVKVSLGYEMEMRNPTFVTLEPHWYVLYGNRWQRIEASQVEAVSQEQTVDEEEGADDDDGLESN